MAVLEKIMQMKQQGQTDVEIVDSLRQEGISPVEINEAISQSKIKSAIGTEQIPQQPIQKVQAPPFQQRYASEIPSPQDAQMQPSMMQSPIPAQAPEEIPTQYQPQTPYAEAPQYTGEPQYEEDYPEYQSGTDIETITEVAEQITEEKTRNLKKQITTFAKFQEESQLEIERISNRLEKIENTISELQMAIIGKIGEYGKDIQTIAKEMNATQNSFSKILDPLTDNIRELQKITGNESESEKPKPKTKSKSKSSKKKKESFEDYLR